MPAPPPLRWLRRRVTRSVADAHLSADLELRLELTRWPNEVGDGTWKYGMPRKVLRDIVEYWRDHFDWRAAERRLNGGHFAALEQPRALASDIHGAFSAFL
jgi:hypothetical protein